MRIIGNTGNTNKDKAEAKLGMSIKEYFAIATEEDKSVEEMFKELEVVGIQTLRKWLREEGYRPAIVWRKIGGEEPSQPDQAAG